MDQSVNINAGLATSSGIATMVGVAAVVLLLIHLLGFSVVAAAKVAIGR